MEFDFDGMRGTTKCVSEWEKVFLSIFSHFFYFSQIFLFIIFMFIFTFNNQKKNRQSKEERTFSFTLRCQLNDVVAIAAIYH